jgi:hypothetical protein
MSQTHLWLLANLGQPNRDATSWRAGRWNIEIAYVMGEGTLHIWDDKESPGRKLVTRGRDETDFQTWMDALEACLR